MGIKNIQSPPQKKVSPSWTLPEGHQFTLTAKTFFLALTAIIKRFLPRAWETLIITHPRMRWKLNDLTPLKQSWPGKGPPEMDPVVSEFSGGISVLHTAGGSPLSANRGDL